MSKYILQRHLPGNDYGEWGRNWEFDAEDDEEAKELAMEHVGEFKGGYERLRFGDSKIRIMKVVFEGLPSQTGHPYPDNERVEELEAKQTADHAEIWLEAKSGVLDYKELQFVLQTVPEVLDGAGYHLRLLYIAGYGFMGHASEEEVEHSQDKAKLAPRDVTISAYYIKGPEGAQCVSVSKVVNFEADGKTPKELIHLWPLEFGNLAISPEKLQGVEIKDEREKNGSKR